MSLTSLKRENIVSCKLKLKLLNLIYFFSYSVHSQCLPFISKVTSAHTAYLDIIYYVHLDRTLSHNEGYVDITSVFDQIKVK